MTKTEIIAVLRHYAANPGLACPPETLLEAARLLDAAGQPAINPRTKTSITGRGNMPANETSKNR